MDSIESAFGSSVELTNTVGDPADKVSTAAARIILRAVDRMPLWLQKRFCCRLPGTGSKEKDENKDMFKIKKISISLIMILAVGLVIGLSTTNSFAQRPDREANPTIKLKKNAKKNGYKVRLSAEAIYAQANNVIDLEGILLEGVRRILYRCLQDSEYIIRDEVRFIAGRSDEFELECDLLDGFESGSISVWSLESTPPSSQR